MSIEEFWHGDVWLAEVYQKAYKLRLQEQSYKAWLQGLYVYDAVATIAVKLTSKRQAQYMEKPIDIFKPQEPQETTAQQEIKAVTSMLEAMMEAAKGKENGGQG